MRLHSLRVVSPSCTSQHQMHMHPDGDCWAAQRHSGLHMRSSSICSIDEDDLDVIVYRALQALGCTAASTAERETANYQGRVCKRQPTATMRRHVRRASHEEGSGMGASYMQLLPLVAPAPNPSRPQASRHTRVRPMRTMQIQSSYPQVCPFAPKWMGLIQANAWWASRASRDYSSL